MWRCFLVAQWKRAEQNAGVKTSFCYSPLLCLAQSLPVTNCTKCNIKATNIDAGNSLKLPVSIVKTIVIDIF